MSHEKFWKKMFLLNTEKLEQRKKLMIKNWHIDLFAFTKDELFPSVMLENGKLFIKKNKKLFKKPWILTKKSCFLLIKHYY